MQFYEKDDSYLYMFGYVLPDLYREKACHGLSQKILLPVR